MPPALQAKLLRVLESGAVRAVGANKERTVDVRVVAATHRDLESASRAGALPRGPLLPARRRRHRASRRSATGARTSRCSSSTSSPTPRAKHPRSPVERLRARGAWRKLIDYRWPGNVRELAHAIERVVLLGREAEVRVERSAAQRDDAPRPGCPSLGGAVLPIREVQRRYAAWALETARRAQGAHGRGAGGRQQDAGEVAGQRVNGAPAGPGESASPRAWSPRCARVARGLVDARRDRDGHRRGMVGRAARGRRGAARPRDRADGRGLEPGGEPPGAPRDRGARRRRAPRRPRSPPRDLLDPDRDRARRGAHGAARSARRGVAPHDGGRFRSIRRRCATPWLAT